MLRLVVYAPNGVSRFPLSPGPQAVGSGTSCEIRFAGPGIEERHAVVLRDDSGVSIESLSRAPLKVNGESVRAARLDVLDEVRLGGVTLIVEESEQRARGASEASVDTGIELEGARPGPAMLVERLSALSDWVVNDSTSRTSLEEIVGQLLAGFGGGACFLFEGEPEQSPGLKLSVTSEGDWLDVAGDVLEIVSSQPHMGGRTMGRLSLDFGDRRCLVFYRFVGALERTYFMTLVIPFEQLGDWDPDLGFAAVADLLVLGLVHHVGRFEPILPGYRGQRDLTLAPGFVAGPSGTVKTLLEQLRSVADSTAHVSLVGEPGSGRELVGRTLHLSGPLRDGPFVVADCRDDNSTRLEADLFGAEIQGRSGPVRRDGKIALSTGGTLFLVGVEELPMSLQSRLVRLLRSGSYEAPEGERTVERIRLICASDRDLESLATEDRVRIDLAYLLSQFTLNVPPLRERIEDLPLLIQTFVNRFSHESGKRVRGITVPALSALAAYTFPGNLRELENIVRQMVFLALPESPMDVELLPAHVRQSSITGARPGAGSHLELARLVAQTERAAIVEALKRTDGNKSQAARLLGLSRNGLAQKIVRLGL